MKTLLAILPVLAAAACAMQGPQPEAGRALYSDLCASCHGVDGRGDGPMAAQLKVKPANLTTLSARHGGTFPRVYVMSMIDGYNRAKGHGGMMPVFDPLLQGPTVLIDTGDGVETPTPARLVDLADYIQTLQSKG
ncbi:c-type cytochrome [Acidimangrovimonas sediminis]|uniref:c-type cytochrome n=1 Tax=Acidimangrovimonas sediminis TaxID=2056283 RepID=UPI000C80AC66|nr:cytochrome c [Acidimangrovimonas sediminis]